MNMKHIVISGQRHAGKSTLIQKLLQANRRPVSGFYTKKGPVNDDGLYPVYIYPAAQTERFSCDENCLGFCNRKVRMVNRRVFDTLGARYLQSCENGIIVMDELGMMEAQASGFTEAVLRTLDGDIPLIAAVKARDDIAFLNAVRGHPKVCVYEITEENRDALYDELLPLIREWNRQNG